MLDIGDYSANLDPNMTAMPDDPCLDLDLAKLVIKDVVHEIIDNFPMFIVNAYASLGWYTGNDFKYHICKPKEYFEFTFKYDNKTPKNSLRYIVRSMFSWKETETELRITMAQNKSGLMANGFYNWILLPYSSIESYSFEDRREF